MSLSARIVDSTRDGGDVEAAPPTPNAWKLDALAVGVLLVAAALALALHKGIV